MAKKQKKQTFKTMIEAQVKRGSVPENIQKAREWYRQKAIRMREDKLVGGNPSKLLQQIGERNERMKTTLKHRLMLGKMWMFQYDPKFKDSLPYYDAFPCIFAIESYSDGFLGLNLHYLPHVWRAAFMDVLYDLLTDDKMNNKTRLNLYNNGYEILNESAKYDYFRPCIKKYLSEHVRSRFMEIPPDEWEIALFLPLERFIGASNRKVWNSVKRNYTGARGSGLTAVL